MKSNHLQHCIAIQFFVLLAASGSAYTAADNSNYGYQVSKQDQQRIVSTAYELSLPFITNQGQIDGDTVFYAKIFGGGVAVTSDGEILYPWSQRSRIRYTPNRRGKRMSPMPVFVY